MDTTISWMIGGGFRAEGADGADERRLAHIRALREAGARDRDAVGRLAGAANAALGGLLGRKAPVAATSSRLSLDTACCLA
jgi:hypothetical protein